MYDNPHEYLLHIPRLFRAFGKSSFEAGAAQRTSDGLGVALWLPPGVHSDDGPLEAVIAESITGEKQTEVGTVFERTEHYRPREPHWYLSLIGVEALHRNKGCGAALLQHGLRQCDPCALKMEQEMTVEGRSGHWSFPDRVDAAGVEGKMALDGCDGSVG